MWWPRFPVPPLTYFEVAPVAAPFLYTTPRVEHALRGRMCMMLRRLILVLLGLGLGLRSPNVLLAAAPPSPAQIQHGEYLVLHVAMCVQCHTPRDDQGQLNRTRLL